MDLIQNFPKNDAIGSLSFRLAEWGLAFGQAPVVIYKGTLYCLKDLAESNLLGVFYQAITSMRSPHTLYKTLFF